jgi:hypothetical protein
MAIIWPSIISTARRLNSRVRGAGLPAIVLCTLLAIRGASAQACPFCTALTPTLSQQKAAAAVTLLAEVQREATGGPAELKVHHVLTGERLVDPNAPLAVPLDLAAAPGQLLVLFGSGSADQLSWHAVAVDEFSYGYLAAAPPRNLSQVERLPYFARFLEHPDKLIAEDAYLEFGHAPFDVVEQTAHLLPTDQVRRWLTSEIVPPHRKGFYALVLGLARDPKEQQTNRELLERLILAPEDDFRAGFDGILGGYLLLSGERGLELIESRYLTSPDAAVGDVRHVQTALRFYQEYGRQIPTVRLCEATRHLLKRPEFAESAIIDLARWQDWGQEAAIAAFYNRPGYCEPAIRRAIVGYLSLSPHAQARVALDELRAVDPRGVAAAEQVLKQTGSVPQPR